MNPPKSSATSPGNQLSKLIQKEIGNLKEPIVIEEEAFKSIAPLQNSPVSNGFGGKL